MESTRPESTCPSQLVPYLVDLQVIECVCFGKKEVLGIPKVTSFSRMRISVAVNCSSSSMESVLNVGLYFEKMGIIANVISKLFVFFDIHSKYILPINKGSE